MRRTRIRSLTWRLGLVATLCLVPVGESAAEPDCRVRWWKGQLHCHSHWSDGDHYPEMVYDRYQQLGFHFVSLTDHNVLSEGTRWIRAEEAKGGPEALAAYRDRFGDAVETRERDGVLEVRLQTLEESRRQFEKRGRFCILQGEEITNRLAHVGAVNLCKKIRPPGGASAAETIESSVRSVKERSSMAILNHPNWHWSVTAEDILASPSLQFFEVYNGLHAAHNHGDETHAGLERVWDIVLAHRLTQGKGALLMGVATDDAHVFSRPAAKRAIPGQGWVVVRCPKLAPTAIVEAMRAGDFYASTGVELKSIRFDGDALHVEVAPEDGVTYTTRFIGTSKGCDLGSEPVLDDQGKPLHVTRRHGEDIGRVLLEVEGVSAQYVLTGSELYVRAKVISSTPKHHAHVEGETEVAWTQPVMPGNRPTGR